MTTVSVLERQQARLKWVQLQQQVLIQNNTPPPPATATSNSGPEFQLQGLLKWPADNYDDFFPNLSVSVLSSRRPEFGGCTSSTSSKMDLAPPLPLPLPLPLPAAADYRINSRTSCSTSSCQITTTTTFHTPTTAVPVIKEEEAAGDQDHVILLESTTGSGSTGREISFNKRKPAQGQGVAVAEDDYYSKCKDKRLKAEVELLGKSEVSRINSSSKKPDYIHVRARRGQATDSHSLAERARREKISKKMKCLQDLVPGCSKITGKAGMLDEIINYVQSLQRQVEFLSMKLAALNPTTAEFNVDSYLPAPAKEFPAYVANFPAAAKSATMLPHLGLGSCLHQYLTDPLQKEAAATPSNCGMLLDHATVVLHPPPQTAIFHHHQEMPNPEQTLTSSSSCITLNQLQPFSTWNVDLQGLYNLYGMGFH